MDFFKGLKDEFETAVVNEPSVFESLKFYCIVKIYKIIFFVNVSVDYSFSFSLGAV